MRNPATKSDFTVPPTLTGLIEPTRPLAAGTLRRLERKLEVVKAIHEIAADSAPRANRFARALVAGAELVRQRALRAAVERCGAYCFAGVEPAVIFRELCIGAAGAVHKYHVDDLRGLLSVVHAAGLAWPACDAPRPVEVGDALAYLGVSAENRQAVIAALTVAPTPRWLGAADKLRATGVRGGAFAALAAEGLGEWVATGLVSADEAEAMWEEEIWRAGELADLVGYVSATSD